MQFRASNMFLLLIGLYSVHSGPAADSVTSLPYAPKLLSKHWSGFLDISKSKKTHYYFVESESSPSTDPVMLFMNGGPGCSSLDALFYENGPLLINHNGNKLVRNPWTWAKSHSMLYLEAPIGVGFSYASGKSDYRSGDVITANDNLKALKKFFAAFPKFSKNDFYLSGESYAGLYVPMLAALVHKSNTAGLEKKINLKGIMVGNGIWDELIFKKTQLAFDYGHGLYSTRQYNKAAAACRGSHSSYKCRRARFSLPASLNMYNVIGSCFTASRKTVKIPSKSSSYSSSELSQASPSKSSSHSSSASAEAGSAHQTSELLRGFGASTNAAASKTRRLSEMAAGNEASHADSAASRAMLLRSVVESAPRPTHLALRIALGMGLQEVEVPNAASTSLSESVTASKSDPSLRPNGIDVPCIDSTGGNIWLNRKDVRKAMNTDSSPNTWSLCTSPSKLVYNANSYYQHTRTATTYWKQLVGQYKILIYSGDVDRVVNYLGTEQCVADLKQKLISEWKPWNWNCPKHGPQVAGFMTKYSNALSFTTIRGAGHMVPQWRPQAALAMVENFVKSPST